MILPCDDVLDDEFNEITKIGEQVIRKLDKIYIAWKRSKEAVRERIPD